MFRQPNPRRQAPRDAAPHAGQAVGLRRFPATSQGQVVVRLGRHNRVGVPCPVVTLYPVWKYREPTHPRSWKARASSMAIVLLICGGARAEADPLSEIESAVDGADFDRAQTLATQELSSGRLDRSRVARVYLLMGIIAAAKRDGAAEASFRKALALEPTLGLPPSAGPHIAA